MSNYTADRIEKPKYFKLGPLRTGRSAKTPHIMGFDTEAMRGQPILLQLSEHGGWNDADLYEIQDGPHVALNTLMRWVGEHCRDPRQEHLLFGFNLQYEWTQLFGDVPPEVVAQNEFTIDWFDVQTDEGWTLKVLNSKRYAMTLRPHSHRRPVVRVLDGHAFFPGSLASVAKMLGLEELKDEVDKARLANLTRADLEDPVIRKYSAQDAVVTRLMGERVMEMHEQYDVPTSLTTPHFASRVYRHRFLSAEIPLPGPALEQAGLWSYHGGKNGFYLHRPTTAKAWNLDIVSAYPEAMRALPALETAVWRQTDVYQPGVHALWEVRMDHHPCRFGGALTHGGQPLRRGTHTLWLTGYELDVMVERTEAQRWRVLDGWVMEGETGGGSFADYVDTFFEMKRTSSGLQRTTAKLLLNGLYGKLFQKVPLGTVDTLQADLDTNGEYRVWTDSSNPLQDFDYRAGGLYHPPLASLVTGFVRAKVHRLEHKYAAMATSTDGLFARNAPWTADLGDGLGKLTAEYGTLNIWRERLYDFIPKGIMVKPKVALHGFRGDPDTLRQIPLSPGSYVYKASHPVTLRESQRLLRDRHYRPGEFAVLDFTLDLT